MELIAGEELMSNVEVPLEATTISDEKINEKYIKGDIRIVTEQARYPLNTVSQIVESSSYKLSPEYQRRHRWAIDRQSRLIESLIMNVPVPPIFLYEYDYSKYEVMDGLQRLTAIHDFYRDKYSLTGLSKWTELNGRNYSNLPEKVREGIDRRYLSSVILLKETAKDEIEALRLKQMVFERINSGGERLNPQETRNAIFDGPLNRLCIKLSKTPALCRLWGITEPEAAEHLLDVPSDARIQDEAFRRMDDVELVLRFFAYRQKHARHKGGSLANYLDNYLRLGNNFNAQTLEQLKDLFVATTTLTEEVFGEKAFWLYRKRNDKWGWLDRPTTTAYDALMATMSGHIAEADILRGKAAILQAAMPEFYKTNYATFEGRNVNQSALAAREQLFEGFIKTQIES